MEWKQNSYSVRLQTDVIEANDPAHAAQIFKRWAESGDYIVEVTHEQSGKKFTVDFAEEPEDQLLEIKHYDLDEDDMARIALVKQLMNEVE